MRLAFIGSAAGALFRQNGSNTRFLPGFFPNLPSFQHELVVGRTASLTSASSTSLNFSSAAHDPAHLYIVNYEYVPDVLERRGPHRESHLGILKRLVDEGRCVMAGPTGDVEGSAPPSGARCVFTDVESAKEFVENDPYVTAGIVTGHSIEKWTIAVKKE